MTHPVCGIVLLATEQGLIYLCRISNSSMLDMVAMTNYKSDQKLYRHNSLEQDNGFLSFLIKCGSLKFKFVPSKH
jgi:hypothetical protein